MKQIDAELFNSLTAARDGGIEPVYFVYIAAKDRATGAAQPMGLWTGDEDIAINVRATTGGLVSRTFLGNTNLSVEGIQYVVDLTDNPITVSFSQIADATQQLVRGTDVRLAYCEVHATTWTKGRLTGTPELVWVGIVDDVDIATPDVNGEGQIGLSVRSDAMSQLTAVNPAKSSHAQQQKRQAGDTFSKYSGSIKSRNVRWYYREG